MEYSRTAVSPRSRMSSTLPRDLTERGVPHVLANRVLDHPESHCCAVDNAGGVAGLGRLLVDLGHRRIASIQGPVATSTGRERAHALRVFLRARGVGLRRELTRQKDFSHDAGRAAALDLLDRVGRPTALVCGNDAVALGALSAARELRIAVPAELTVVRFDDIPMAGWPLIDLTTVHSDLSELADVTVELLLSEIETPGGSPIERRVPVSLMLRGTHRPA